MARPRKHNNYDLSGEYGVGWTTNTNHIFYFDLDDYDKIKDYTWSESGQGYIVSRTDKDGHIKMHRLIFDCHKGDNVLIDHKNLCRHDNRKQNLRRADKQTNGINRGVNKNNKLGFKGIYQLSNGKYQAQIRCNGKGYYKNSTNLEEVIEWRQNKEKELFGEFAYNNSIGGGEKLCL